MATTRRKFLAQVFALSAAPLVARLPAATCSRAVSDFKTHGVIDITYDGDKPRRLAFASPNRKGRGVAHVVRKEPR